MNRIFFLLVTTLVLTTSIRAQEFPKEFTEPPREFSLLPFWFWNDTLKDEEVIRQIADFEAHGVYGFTIHPRIGLPEDVKWLSDEMIRMMHVAISEAEKRNMYVVLYDEGMYPSGSSAGQVVERNPEHAARGLAKIDLKAGEKPVLAEGMKLITIIDRPSGHRVAVVERPSGGVIRGLHYLNEGEQRLREFSPPAGDILNPDAVTSFIELVYDRFYKEFGKYFGKTVIGIFTDEPSPLGRGGARGLVPGNASLLPQINRILGYDITPFLADLWYADNPDSRKHRTDYHRAINICLEENYYKRLGNWCYLHGISLMGHPAGSMDIGTERYFQIPGQDLVWRYVEPGPKALEGQHSTMAKCASSAMLHLGYRRNSNEIYGAYGHNLTWDEVLWLANWCFVRGHNMLLPHAFYYSIRGPRLDERPPDVGPNSKWWNDYKSYADACSRLSWINTDSRQVCDIAILCEATYLPDKPAKILYRNLKDFNYLEIRHLWEDVKVTSRGIKIAGMTYKALIIDTLSYIPEKAMPVLNKIAKKKHLIVRSDSKMLPWFRGALMYSAPEDLINAVNRITDADLVATNPSPGLRYRHVVKDNRHFYMIFNEEEAEVNTSFRLPVTGKMHLTDPYTLETKSFSGQETINFKPHEMKLLIISDAK
ncbi:MAG TPA: hypothetical protein P5180_00375 [Bacteroidales bacterium]|nr:hypothetical protein [Bacteroidales bacterium]HRW83859.1 hypothetical protein [Bacteroidales bacterium]